MRAGSRREIPRHRWRTEVRRYNGKGYEPAGWRHSRLRVRLLSETWGGELASESLEFAAGVVGQSG